MPKSLRALPTKRSNLFFIDPKNIHIEPGFNLRRDDPEVRKHIASIKEQIRTYITTKDSNNRVWDGDLKDVIDALHVRIDGDKVFVVDGHCRLTAINELYSEGFDIKSLAIVGHDFTPSERVLFMMRAALGKPLTTAELALGFETLVDGQGMSIEDATEAYGAVDLERAQQLLLLGRASHGIHELIVDNKVDAEVCIQVLQDHGQETGLAIIEILAKRTGTIIEKAIAYRQLHDQGMGFHEMSRVIGRVSNKALTPQRIEQLVLLGRADGRVHSHVEAGRLTAEDAIRVLRKYKGNPELATKEISALLVQVDIPKKAVRMTASTRNGLMAALSEQEGKISKALIKAKATGGDWQSQHVQLQLPAGLLEQVLQALVPGAVQVKAESDAGKESGI